MNVANRKLFTNRDARAKLSSMGGIMASSPELLGEVQKFAEAGEVKAPMFLVQLPGLIGGNEFLHITAVELQSLKASQPGLMDQRGVVIQQSTPEILSELNPAQLATTDNANVQRMFSDLGVGLQQTDVPVAVEGPGVIDQIKSYFGGGEDTAENNQVSGPAGEAQGITGVLKGLADPYAANMVGTNESGRGSVFGLPPPTKQIGSFLQGVATIPSMVNEAMYSSSNAMAQTLSDAYDSGFGIPYLLSDSEDLMQAKAEEALGDPGLGGPDVNLTDVDYAVRIAEEEQQEKKAQERKLVEASNLEDQRTGAAAQEEAQTNELANIENARKAMALEDVRTGASAQERNQKEAEQVFDERKIEKEIAEGKNITDSIIGNATGTNFVGTAKEKVTALQAMYKEMLGMDDEDEEKEKWHSMAMIGFAIAAGQDPNALSNIAGGLLEGTKMAKKDRMRKQDRDDKFTMMAIQSADEDRRTALAAGVRADERTQDQLNQIALLEKRGEINAATANDLRIEVRRTAKTLTADKIKINEAKAVPISAEEAYLESNLGKFALETYNTIQGNEAISDDEKMNRFVEGVGSNAAAQDFFDALNFDLGSFAGSTNQSSTALKFE